MALLHGSLNPEVGFCYTTQRAVAGVLVLTATAGDGLDSVLTRLELEVITPRARVARQVHVVVLVVLLDPMTAEADHVVRVSDVVFVEVVDETREFFRGRHLDYLS
jgi:hypothetical protein